MNNVPPDPAPLFAPFLARAEAAESEAASLRAALTAEREAHERQTAMWAESGSEMTTALARVSEALGEDCREGSVTLLDVHERVRAKVMSLKATAATAIADRIAAEKERDAFRAQAEASLVVPCACGRPMPSVSSRLRCDACRAEGERDEARAQVVAMRAALLAVWDASARGDAEKCPQDNNLDLTLAICATKTVTDAPDAGAPLRAELRALRAVRARVGAVLVEAGCSCDCGHDSEGHDDDCERCLACLVQGAING